MSFNPTDILDFDIRDYLSEKEISEATEYREMSEEDAKFWSDLRIAKVS